MTRKVLVSAGFALFLLLFITAVAAAGYFYYQYQYLEKNVDSIKQKSADEELKKTIVEVSKLMILPEGETPTMATITDKSKLAEQPFFAHSENGDKVLFYTKAGKAILFRPSVSKVIDVTVIKPSDTTQESQKQTDATKSAVTTLSLYNGTPRNGLTSTFEKKIAAAYPTLKVLSKENAKELYQYSTIIDLSGKNASLIEQLAKTYTASISAKLPANEPRPEADILLILGANAL